MTRHTSRRVARVLKHGDYARAIYLGYLSAYRSAAREQGVAPVKRWEWLCTYTIRHELERAGQATTGAGVLAFAGTRNPRDAHEAALRVLATAAPGLGVDWLTMRAELAAACATVGRPYPYIRISHARAS